MICPDARKNSRNEWVCGSKKRCQHNGDVECPVKEERDGLAV